MAKILLADDDVMLALSLTEWLKSAGYLADSVNTFEEARGMIDAFEYDLIILDWEMPDGTGIDIVSAFRKGGGLTPILMLTGKSTEQDKETGLDAGADDYLTKPFSMVELAARLRALLRRPRSIISDEIRAGDLVLEADSKRVCKKGIEIKFQPMELALLEFFMRHPGKIFALEAIIHRVWDSDSDVSLDAIYTCVKRIRRKIDTVGEDSYFRSVHGVGYEFVVKKKS